MSRLSNSVFWKGYIKIVSCFCLTGLSFILCGITYIFESNYKFMSVHLGELLIISFTALVFLFTRCIIKMRGMWSINLVYVVGLWTTLYFGMLFVPLNYADKISGLNMAGVTLIILGVLSGMLLF